MEDVGIFEDCMEYDLVLGERCYGAMFGSREGAASGFVEMGGKASPFQGSYPGLRETQFQAINPMHGVHQAAAVSKIL